MALDWMFKYSLLHDLVKVRALRHPQVLQLRSTKGDYSIFLYRGSLLGSFYLRISTISRKFCEACEEPSGEDKQHCRLIARDG